MSDVDEGLDRPVYGFGQVDRVLGLRSGTSRRWVNGYTRGGRTYDPVVRATPTGSQLVTWGEFVEVRLLAEFRDADVPMLRLRPTVQRLRDELGTRYPLARAQTWLEVAGREVVRRTQADDAPSLQFTVVRTGQHLIDLSPPARGFVDALEWSPGRDGSVVSLRPVSEVPEVVCHPLRQTGEPTVDGIRVDVLAEQIRVGEPIGAVAEVYGLTESKVIAALRFELVQSARALRSAAA